MKRIYILIVIVFISLIGFSQTQLQLNQESFLAYKKADAEMTATYKLVMNKISDANQKQLLLQAQRAWIKFKEAHCNSVASLYEGGSMKPMVYNYCLVDVTNQRNKELKEFLKNL